MIDDDLPDDAPLRSLPNELAPPAGAESRLVAAMRREGLLRRRTHMRWMLPVAAMFVIAAGLGIYQWRLGSTTPRATYILLLFERPADTGASRAPEYASWARRTPHVIGGEELGRSVATLSPASDRAASPTIAGYFLLDATTDEEARRIAEDCPHRRHGGTVMVRKIERH
jgi:hypothetical protein